MHEPTGRRDNKHPRPKPDHSVAKLKGTISGTVSVFVPVRQKAKAVAPLNGGVLIETAVTSSGENPLEQAAQKNVTAPGPAAVAGDVVLKMNAGVSETEVMMRVSALTKGFACVHRGTVLAHWHRIHHLTVSCT